MSNQHTGLPNTPEEIRAFIGKNFSSLQFGQETEQPHENDTYTLTAHDLISAFQWSEIDAPVSAEPVLRIGTDRNGELAIFTPRFNCVIACFTPCGKSGMKEGLLYAAPVAAQAQPDPRTPADMKVNGGALKLALNALRRSGKNEIADELEKTATPAQQPVSGAEGLPPLPQGITKHGVIGHDADVYTDVHMLDYARAALAQQDDDKVKAGLLSSLVEIVDAVIASDEEGLIEHSETIIKARAAIDAARKEQA